MEGYTEKDPERIPTKEKVLEIIAGLAENTHIVRELSDEQGLYLLEADVIDEKPGETTQYQYMRKGQYPDGNQSASSVIHVIYYQDGIPCGGHDVANLDNE